ncbi:hypothetical protein B0H17DRAFT_927746, partial [Mycena rosella]
DDWDMMWAWRGLTALGHYDTDSDGELILWDEKKVITFPAGVMFLFPSAFMQYFFTRIAPWERQYSKAGLFRYAESGFMSEKNFEATAWQSAHEACNKVRDAHLATALNMYSPISE